MRIILTHEQADFDALASLLGAYLLDMQATPILPHRMNRNVRAFITLYGMDLPFIERRDLPNEPVEGATLVDSQSMVSIKGVSARTQVRVIDHHPLRGDLPEEWVVSTEDTGANTTLFVEIIQERDMPISAIQATLLLMGIYEDTGSLTYTRTTSRDVRAAAYMLDRGANLRIAVDFLNHPLSSQQQVLYDRLRAAMKVYPVHGHSIIISCGDAQEMEEELSTVAHKLRDLLDPDALFLLIKTRNGVQLIARSTSDNIDVADIAGHFGGGGHSRAAASLIRDREVEEICTDLIAVLPRYVHPAVTVAQIMSSGPQVISPDTTAEETLQRMQRYGYEGYPVVQNGKVVGLLSRREVDRAISHKMTTLKANSLMQAGEVTVHPEDSIEHLQRLMTETGWGQVPVTHSQSGEIIGIVTRTDLLKTLTTEAARSTRQNLASRLETALPPARLILLQAIARASHEQHFALYIVGGFVRDLLLEQPSQDFDLVVEGNAITLVGSLSHQYGGRVTSHSRFGTAKWYLNKQRLLEGVQKQASEAYDSLGGLPNFIDLVSARREFYTHPSALPTVESGSIKLDLHRRDFTINTLALRLDGYHYGDLYDYWGGLEDLHQGLIRCLHSLSFVDDPTRMLRAVRFEQRFGFTIEERTLQLISEALSLIERVSGDRIRHELDHILDEERVPRMLIRLEELGILAAIHPDLRVDEWLIRCIENLNNPEVILDWEGWDIHLSPGSRPIPLYRALAYTLWLIRIPTPRLRQVIQRLLIPRTLAAQIWAASELWVEISEIARLRPSAIVERLEKVPSLALAAVYIASADPEQKQVIKNYVIQWRKVAPSVSGHDLIARGLPRGPRYRMVLKTLRDAWLDGEITSQEEELALLEQLVARSSEKG